MKKLCFLLTVLTVALLFVSCTNEILFKPNLDFGVTLKGLNDGSTNLVLGNNLKIDWDVTTNVKNPNYNFNVVLKKEGESTKQTFTTDSTSSYTLEYNEESSVLNSAGTYFLHIEAKETTKDVSKKSTTFKFTIVEREINFVSNNPLYTALGVDYCNKNVNPISVKLNTVDGLSHVIEWTLNSSLEGATNHLEWISSPSTNSIVIDDALINFNGFDLAEGVNVILARVKGSDLVQKYQFIEDTTAPEFSALATNREYDSTKAFSRPDGTVSLFKIKAVDQLLVPSVALGFMDLDNDNERLIKAPFTDSKGYFFINMPAHCNAVVMFTPEGFKVIDPTTNSEIGLYYINTDGNRVYFSPSELGFNFTVGKNYRLFFDARDIFENRSIGVYTLKLNERYYADNAPELFPEIDKTAYETNSASQVNIKLRLNSRNIKDFLNNNGKNLHITDLLNYSDSFSYLQVPFKLESSSPATVSVNSFTTYDFTDKYEQTNVIFKKPNSFVLSEGFSSDENFNSATGEATDAIFEFDLTLTVDSTGVYQIGIPYDELTFKILDKNGRTFDGINVDYNSISFTVDVPSI